MWLRKLDSLPELVWLSPSPDMEFPWEELTLTPAFVICIANKLKSTWDDSATLEQMPNICIAVVCDPAYVASGSEEADHGESHQDI